MGGKLENLCGKQFNDWFVVQRAPDNTPRVHPHWECRCICGIVKIVSSPNLKWGRSKNCGCKRVSGLVKRNFRHGMCDSPLYSVWRSMIERCENPKVKAYKNYGGRGIRIHCSWRTSFEAFRSYVHVGYKPGLELDRIDNDGNYEPGNVRWTTRKSQCRNKRTNILIEFEGKTLPISQWAEILGRKPGNLYKKYHLGKTPREILR